MTATPLTIDELFTPAPSGIGGNANVAPASGSWLAILLQLAATVGLPTTAWLPGQPERSILSIDSVALAQLDAIVSLIAQGGFLDFAASGTVQFPAVNGQIVTMQVTPDPSDAAQNPTGAPGWLDVLGVNAYGATRLQATFASGILAIANTLVAAAGPYTVGTYHVANTRSQATYKNVASLTIPSSRIAGTGGVVTAVTAGSTTTVTTQTAHGVAAGDVVYLNGVGGISGLNAAFAQVSAVPSSTMATLSIVTSGSFTTGGTMYLCTLADFEADVIGLDANAAPGDVTTQITQVNGIATSNLTPWSAANFESNVDYVSRCRSKLAAASPNGPTQAYEYFALTAYELLQAETPSVSLTNGPIVSAKAFGNPQTSDVLVVVASASPASSVLDGAITPGCVGLDVVAATFATPIEITTAFPHGLLTGNIATAAGILGNIAANGTWTITKTSDSTFTLDGSAGIAVYTGGGQISGGDLGQVDRIIQANCVDDNAIAFTISAQALPISISAVVTVPAAFRAVYNAALGTAFDQFLKAQEIGGGDAGVVDYSAIEGVFFEVGVQVVGATSYVKSVRNLLVNGGTGNVAFPSPFYEAILGTLGVSVVGV